MKNKIETDGLISIDLDEEKEKKVKKQELEIKAGDLYIKIPADRSRIRECIAFLEVFEQQLEEPEVILRPRERPTLTEINNEIQDTRQFLEDTQNQQRQIEQRLNLPNLNMPMQPATQENVTLLDKHPTFDKCPLCSSRIKKKKIEVASDGFMQKIRCKNRKCNWEHIYKIKL
jgi:hypothetical protein